jgi:hypothetical protein
MTDRLNGPERIECRLVMIDAHSMRILTTAAPPRPLLPRESIMAYTRVAEALNDAIEQRYGLCTIQLAFLPRAEGQSYCAVHEIIASRESLPGSLSLTALGEIAPSEFSGEDRAIVLAIMKGEASGLGSFARLGWIHDLLAKVGSYRDRGSMPAIRQVNQGIDFCLLSLSDAAVRKVWFKAVGEPNTREYALTVELARRFPAYLPKILATIPDWNGWVMEDVKGVPLNESDSIYQCEQALTALAVMQKEMATDVASLSALGAKDWTCARIACLSEPFFAESQRAMQAQISTKSRPLRSSELHQLKKNIESALHEFMNAGVPETLLHGDIGHGNIIATPNGPVFLDWAETYFGHPFLSAEHLLADLARSNPGFAEKQAALRSFYANQWRADVQPKELEIVAALAPAIAAYSYALMAWEAHCNRPDPTEAWPLVRSMLRRAKRELDQVSEVIA